MRKAHSIILMIILVVALQGFSASYGQTSSNDKILITITKNPVVYLSSQDIMVRAHVEIPDYTPVDGELIMKILKESSGKIVSESTINVRPNSEDIWSAEIAYIVDKQNLNDSDSIIGSYKIQISPENGAYGGSATFSVLQVPTSTDSLAQQTNQPITNQAVNNQTTILDEKSKVPEWVRNIFAWYGEKKISEDELLNAIKFLVTNKIIQLE